MEQFVLIVIPIIELIAFLIVGGIAYGRMAGKVSALEAEVAQQKETIDKNEDAIQGHLNDAGEVRGDLKWIKNSLTRLEKKVFNGDYKEYK